MNVLIACEESQAVCTCFRAKGVNAFSCDIQDCSGGHPEWHVNSDVTPILGGNCTFKTQDGADHTIIGKWDMIIAHPPCTYLTVTQNWCYNVERFGEEKVNKRLAERESAIKFFLTFVNADCERIAIENPVGCMSTIYKKPSQVVHPWQYGDEAEKTTCLWLKGLPNLIPTNIVGKGETFDYVGKNGRIKHYPKWMYDALGKSEGNRRKIRSKTFMGIAEAMADQWYNYILKENENE